MTKLHELYDHAGQSPWIDDLKRSYFSSGRLDELISQGVRGMTSNPTIMARSIEAGTDYDEQFATLISSGVSAEDAYWDLVVEDVNHTLEALAPLHSSSKGEDGYVSLEVAPSVARNTDDTLKMALQLHERINKSNLFVKIPATVQGVAAIEEVIAQGHSINVTLIFSLERYAAVIDAYINGITRFVSGGGDPHKVASVASFFVSRVDTEVDKRLEAVAAGAPGSPTATRALELRGKAAIAQARLAYALFKERFMKPEFEALGANYQRPLWASTSTKNPAYSDLYYVEALAGANSVDTMPETTIQAFLDHGDSTPHLEDDLDGARASLAGLGEVGVDMDDVTRVLEEEGLSSFASSFDDLIDSLHAKATTLQNK